MFVRLLLPICAVASTALGQDISSLAGPFRLVTTTSQTTPVVVSSYLNLYYYTLNNANSAGLTLFTSDFAGEENETFRLLNGVLGTYYRPDDVSGSSGWNATTPASNSYASFANQAVAHAGFDLVGGTFLAIHGVASPTWYLCTDSYGFQVLTYTASASRGCTSTIVAQVTA